MALKYFIFTLLFTGLIASDENSDDVIVELDDGSVRGTTMTSSGGQDFFAFLGIPYAESPTDELRFKAPVVKKPWKATGEILDATKDGPMCAQFDLLTRSFNGQEDCLSINVYTPQIPSKDKSEKYPVLVFIHGGAFKAGTGANWMYGPNKFIDLGIVFVTMNYRLGALGFLSTGDDASPGNYGLLDQLEALKWVQRNIAAFGGDPNKVTISGHSAGSASVLYHILSPMTKGLFHRAIAMSGSAACRWASSKNPTFTSQGLAERLKCPTANAKQLVECLRKVAPKKLVDATTIFEKDILISFSPVVDNSFVIGDPEKLLAEGKIANKVPVVMGITKDEGAGIYAIAHGKLKKYSEEFLISNIRTILSSHKPLAPGVVKLIKKHYFNNEIPENEVETTKSISKMYTDGIIDICHYQTMKYLIEASFDVYAYSYDFNSGISIINAFGIRKNLGVVHGDELLVYFTVRPMATLKLGKNSDLVIKRMTTLFANFTKTGNPAPEKDNIQWPLTTEASQVQLYHIDEPAKVETMNPFQDPRFDFWLKHIPETIRKGDEISKDEL